MSYPFHKAAPVLATLSHPLGPLSRTHRNNGLAIQGVQVQECRTHRAQTGDVHPGHNRGLVPELWQQHRSLGVLHGLQLGACRHQCGCPATGRLRPQEQDDAIVVRPLGHGHGSRVLSVPRWTTGHRIPGLPGQAVAHSRRGSDQCSD